MSRCLLCQVFGKVQGVWYRASTQQEAERLGVTGYARNMDDGSVEVLMCGEESALEALKEWLQEGPPLSDVTDILCRGTAESPPASFSTR